MKIQDYNYQEEMAKSRAKHFRGAERIIKEDVDWARAISAVLKTTR